MFTPKYSLKTLLLVITCTTVVMFFVRREANSTRGRFRRMHRAAAKHLHEYWGPLYDSNTGDFVRPQFEKKINSGLLPFLNRLPQPLHKELREYLETSMPIDDYISYQWTYLSADSIAELFKDPVPECLEAGYFPFAYSDGYIAAISSQNGKVYCSFIFDENISYEAESIKEFIDHSRLSWEEDESIYPLNQ